MSDDIKSIIDENGYFLKAVDDETRECPQCNKICHCFDFGSYTFEDGNEIYEAWYGGFYCENCKIEFKDHF